MELAYCAERTVNFVRADVVKTHILSIVPLLAYGFEQVECSADVRLDKIFWTEYRPVHMALGRKVDNNGDIVLGQHIFDHFVIADITTHEKIILATKFFTDVC